MAMPSLSYPFPSAPTVLKSRTVCERIGQFASNHKGLDEDDCEAIKFHARELLRDILSNCARIEKGADNGTTR